MPNQRVYRPTTADFDQAKQVRKIIEEAREVLRQPPPDTFLGRKTQPPFPKAEDDD